MELHDDQNGTSNPIAVIIPSLNEGMALARTISQLYEHCTLPAHLGEPRVIVVEGGNNPSLPAALRKSHPKLDIVTFAYPSRGEQQNCGAQATTEPILLFLHADTLLPHGWDASVVSLLSADETPTVGAFTLSLPEPLSVLLHVMLFGANIRAKYFWLPYGDQAYFLTRKTFNLIGGFPRVPIMEDLGLLRSVRQANGRVSIHDHAVVTSPRRWIKNGVIWNTVLNQLLIFAWICGATPERIYRWYYGKWPESSKDSSPTPTRAVVDEALIPRRRATGKEAQPLLT